MCAILKLAMIAPTPTEYLLGYSPDGLFEIIVRPGKFFFRKKKIFFKFLVLYEILIGVMYRVYRV